MRPKKLTMKAFGPYSGQEIIDFTQLKERNLFLVTGPTGSGKTTIFDAISYAMFGESSGNIRTGESLRSQFALDSVLTEVDFEFELKGLSYQIHRIPTQMKPKSRGEGFTEQKSAAELMIEGTAKPITGVRNVNEKIESMMGINAEQFRQIMMIPQGEFRKLLLADSEDREKVLQKLFDTKLYYTVQSQLDMKAKELNREIKSSTDLRNHEIGKIQADEGEGLYDLLADTAVHVDAIISATKEKIENDGIALKKMDESLEKGKGKVTESINQREHAKQINNTFDELEKQDAELSKLKAKDGEIHRLEKTIDAAEKARGVLVAEENVLTSKKSLASKQKAEAECQKDHEQAEAEETEAKRSWEKESSPEAEKQRDKAAEDVRNVQSYEEKVKRIEAEKTDLQTHEEAYANKQAEINAVEQSCEKLDTQLVEANKRKEDAQRAEIELLQKQGEMKALTDENDQIKAYLDAEEKLAKQQVKVEEAKAQLETREAQRATAEESYKRTKLSFFQNQAAALAKELQEGQECPVCGGTDHPDPAKFVGEVVTEDKLQATEKAFHAAVEKWNKKNTALKVLEDLQGAAEKETKRILEKLQGIVMDEMVFQNLEEQMNYYANRMAENKKQITALKQEELRLKGIIKQSENIEDEIKKINEKHAEEKEKKAQAEEACHQADQKRLQKKAVLDELYRDVPEGLRTLQTLETKLKEVQANKEELQEAYKAAEKSFIEKQKALLTVSTRHQQLQRDLLEEQGKLTVVEEQFKSKRMEAGFDTEESYQAAKCEEDQVAEMRTVCETHKKAVYAAEENLKRLRKEIKGKAKVSIDEINDAIAVLNSANDDLMNQIIQKRKQMEDNQKTIEEVKSKEEEIKAKSKRYAVLGNLANVAQGKNPARITFERYVLAAFLEDILDAANIRLKQMSNERYWLTRTDELERKNKQSGLELKVFDEYTGKFRHVKTLSGGEGFMASLSMALGLSDVVQAYAGGVQLDTMFIDEGFGTLDPEALDGAINCLIDLQKSGRLIGIISHVQELKERIDTRLEVTTSYAGSTAKFVIG